MNGNQEELKSIESEYESKYLLLDPTDPLFKAKVKSLKQDMLKQKIKAQAPRMLWHLSFLFCFYIILILLKQ